MVQRPPEKSDEPLPPRRVADVLAPSGAAIVAVIAVALFGGMPAPAAAFVAVTIFMFAVGYLFITATAPAGLDSNRDAAEAVLAQARRDREMRASIIEALSEPAMYIDAQGKVAAANAAARRQFRFLGAEPQLTQVVRRPELLDAVATARRDREPQSFAFTDRDETDRYFACVASPVGEGGGVLVSMHDLTELKRVERARVDFLANASHELRTPLTSLAGFIETMRGPARDDPEAWDRFLEIMQAQAERMKRLISDLLSLSRIELSEHRPPDTQADLAAVVKEVGDALAPMAKAKNVKLRISGPASGVMVAGLRDELTQVAQNLMDNALKYSDSGDVVEVEILTGLGREEAAQRAGRRWEHAGHMSIVTSPLAAPAAGQASGRFVVLRVADAGPGIDRQHLPRLSERFYRVDQGRGLRPGTGLGLAIVKHVVARHRGEFLVESEPGQGSAFGVVLPAWPNPAAVKDSPAVNAG